MTSPLTSERPSGRRLAQSRRRRRILKWIAAISAVLVVFGGARPAFHWFKSSRATQLAVSANTLVVSGNLKDAADKFRAALQLDPVNYDALRGAAQLASRVRRPEALGLWEQVVKSPRATVADRQGYVEEALRAGRPRLVAGIIDRLLKEDPGAKTLGLASQFARSAGESAKAIQFARLAVKNSPNDDAARLQLATLLAASGDKTQRTEAQMILWSLSRTSGTYRQAAIEGLASAPGLSEAERLQVLQLLQNLTPENLKDALLAADVRLQLPMADAHQIYDETIARWNHGSVSELVDLARWLNLHQQFERVLSLFPLEKALNNNQLLLARLDALAALKRWNEIDALLSRGDLTLDPSVLECFRAKSAQEQNAGLDAQLHWNRAMSLAGTDPTKLRTVAEFAELSRAAAVALKAYEQLAKSPDHAALAYRGIERLSGEAGDTIVQRAAAEKIKALTGNEPNAVAQLAYINLLAGNDIEASAATARQLVQKYPDRVSFRVIAALGCLRQHNSELALQQFKAPAGAPPIDWNKTPAPWRAVYAAVLTANDQADAAREIIKAIPMNQLSADEQALIAR